MENRNFYQTMKRIDPSLSELYKSWQSQSEDVERPLRIAGCGLLKAGKSTLLNMLTGHFETEYFKTAVIRETTKNKEFVMDQFAYIDTPGIDADIADDAESFSGVAQADIFLMVHNLRTGELDAKEMEYLKRITAIKNDNLSDRLILVLTHLESAGEVCEQITKKILQQCQEINLVPQYFLVSNSSFKKGTLENKKMLAKSSGIPDLSDFLNEKHETFSRVAIEARSKQNAASLEKLKNEIQLAIRTRQEKMQSLQKLHKKSVEKFSQRINKLVLDTRAAIANYDQL